MVCVAYSQVAQFVEFVLVQGLVHLVEVFFFFLTVPALDFEVMCSVEG